MCLPIPEIYDYHCRLAYEPIIAQVTHGYSCRLPAYSRFYRETNFFGGLKSILPTLKTNLRTFPLFSRVSRQIVQWVHEL